MNLSFRRQILLPALAALAGLGIASAITLTDLHTRPFYEPFTYTLLAIGLYGSVHGIHLEELRTQRGIILRAVTLGVLLKAAIIGGVLYLFTRQVSAFLIALTVAQIDPLSVANLLTGRSNKLSERARTILSAWSSFDDPMTVLLSIYALYWFTPGSMSGTLGQSLLPFFSGFIQNLAFAALAFWLSRQIKGSKTGRIFLLAACFVAAVSFRWMLGMALIGLFLRPSLKRLPMLISAAFYTAVLLLGFLLINGISWAGGLVLAAGATLAQAAAGLLLTRSLPRAERLYLACAQQNGITAMILALLFEPALPGTVGIVGPAILLINLGYYLSNRFLLKT